MITYAWDITCFIQKAMSPIIENISLGWHSEISNEYTSYGISYEINSSKQNFAYIRIFTYM